MALYKFDFNINLTFLLSTCTFVGIISASAESVLTKCRYYSHCCPGQSTACDSVPRTAAATMSVDAGGDDPLHREARAVTPTQILKPLCKNVHCARKIDLLRSPLVSTFIRNTYLQNSLQ